MIDDKTPNLQLPLPNAANMLEEDVARLRSAFGMLDAALPSKADLVAGKVPAAQLPSFVDDVIEVADYTALPATGESGKIYVTLADVTVNGTLYKANTQYRWGGSAYIAITASPGTTDDVPEGGTNLYFTAQRARDAVGTVSAAYVDQLFTATAGQTTFAVTGGYTVGNVDVHVDGVEFVGGGDDYTAINGTTVVMTSGLVNGAKVRVRKWSISSVAGAVQKSGDTMTGDLTVPNLIVTGTLDSSAAVTVISANTAAQKSRTYVMTASLRLTLPATPSPGDRVMFVNRSATSTPVIARNGRNIMGLAEDMTLDNVNHFGVLIYADSTNGWIFN
jgi:hypothetical protein